MNTIFADPAGLFAKLLALLVGLVLHEFMHGYVAHRLGDNTAQAEGRLTLNPAAHIDPFATLFLPLALILIGSPIVFAAAKPVPFNPWMLKGGRWGAALVAAAGPLTNLVIAILAGIALQFFTASPVLGTILFDMILTNVGLFIFNLIPFPPLDGSRILYAVVPANVREGMDRIERGGLAGIGIFLLVLYVTPLGSFVNGLIISVVRILIPNIAGF
jgi:Zn-dependent protease